MKKRIISIFVVFAMVIALVPVVAVAETSPTVKILPNFIAPIEVIDPNNPEFADWIPISDRAGLEAIAKNYLSLQKNYYLTNDIDLGDEEWHSISNYEDYSQHGRAFYGIFDGQGYVIRNMKNAESRYAAGLFGYARYAEIRNVGLEGINISFNNDYHP
ncbi:MAG: hypothetical protein FWF82_03710, partial [Oscillospiraceae bacterium]|nr:hypothetical protein [Oscillospiraceae bacterium]